MNAPSRRRRPTDGGEVLPRSGSRGIARGFGYARWQYAVASGETRGNPP